MRARAKLTSKGQITIPAEIRHALGISTGDIVVFEAAEGYATLAKRRSAVEIAAELRGKYPALGAARAPVSKTGAIESHFAHQLVSDETPGRYGSSVKIARRTAGSQTPETSS